MRSHSDQPEGTSQSHSYGAEEQGTQQSSSIPPERKSRSEVPDREGEVLQFCLPPDQLADFVRTLAVISEELRQRLAAIDEERVANGYSS